MVLNLLKWERMRRGPFKPSSHPASGFTLIELLITVAIIALLAAVSLPAISRFIRNYEIQGAAQQIASELGTARLKAISKTVSSGVAFIPAYPQADQYQFIVEDTPGNITQRSPAPPRGAPVNGPPHGVIRLSHKYRNRSRPKRNGTVSPNSTTCTLSYRSGRSPSGPKTKAEL
ncbi:MAG TPA: prepilin-type N-terminal cleavage/methylation domain-containing protein [Vicinamibacteria bacterium]|nr:prepilin-type N-terminal cleavage/methylation domain-containing protein [Vicinamibacteria bacterium]